MGCILPVWTPVHIAGIRNCGSRPRASSAESREMEVILRSGAPFTSYPTTSYPRSSRASLGKKAPCRVLPKRVVASSATRGKELD
ncbi:hypothetical protein MAPG_03954 [Magnaporthiopsis poae ATCC 64411]|uniref:Uncharacterized protein n=1 Tax=Magnaporthiopsis poae (strain ATCC 64411 / 73-15) TaxID=644358 RepID=A0A0C4DVF0_MAGP6|nr:hypothetical protein MAPG_03954 [Magnaporthiopsis poae ATCC 64411]